MSEVVAAQKEAIKELKKAIKTFESGHLRTRVVPLAIPTGWGKTRIALQAILKARYRVNPIVIIWPQKEAHMSKEVWLRKENWCRNHKKQSCGCSGKKLPHVRPLRPSKPGPKSKRHDCGAGDFHRTFKGTFYSINNKMRGVHHEIAKTHGTVIFVIDEWHTKKFLSRFDGKQDPERFWRETLLGDGNTTKRLFVLLISATPIGATDEMDNLGLDDDGSDDVFEQEIKDALKKFKQLTSVGNQKRRYNLYKVYPRTVAKMVAELKKKRELTKFYPGREKNAWISEYVKRSRKALKNHAEIPRPPSLVYALESLLTSGATAEIVRKREKGFPSMKSYFRSGFDRQTETMKLATIKRLLKHFPDQKFVVFCHYKAVARSLDRYLHNQGFNAYYLEGNIKADHPEFNDFNREDGDVRVLIVTDRHSQGVNLHRSEAWLVHFELSWNPIRIIQRFGRVWRIKEDGNLTVPAAFHIPHAFSAEEEMVRRLDARWNVLENESKKEAANFVDLAPIPFKVALGFRCSPDV